MANAMYPSAKQNLLSGAFNYSSADIRVILVDLADYTYNSAHDFLNDVAAGARVATSNALDSPTITNGTFDAADEVLGSVTGDEAEALILYQHTGTEGTSALIVYFDTGITGAPVTPNGGDITVQWNASGIFAL